MTLDDHELNLVVSALSNFVVELTVSAETYSEGSAMRDAYVAAATDSTMLLSKIVGYDVAEQLISKYVDRYGDQ